MYITKTEHTALMCAAFLDNSEFIRVLIGAGANVNVQTVDGDTALMLACDRGNPDTVMQLIEAGANLDLVELVSAQK